MSRWYAIKRRDGTLVSRQVADNRKQLETRLENILYWLKPEKKKCSKFYGATVVPVIITETEDCQ